MNPAENSTTVSELVVQLLARELRLKPSDIDPKAPLIELGLDSMSALIIAGDLEDRWHIAYRDADGFDLNLGEGLRYVIAPLPSENLP